MATLVEFLAGDIMSGLANVAELVGFAGIWLGSSKRLEECINVRPKQDRVWHSTKR